MTTEPGSEFTYTVLGSVPVPIVRLHWTFSSYGSGTLVAQTWQLIAADPVPGSTDRDLDDLRYATIASVEATLVSLASWIADRPAG
ncbi:hypothetical protein [Pseudonocardia sp. KRD291]|uniref:hypothetical protein n=1 Tax=Pseudonocardia sp. KRD291 TaxID=2792007 RepID=UPI001C5C10C4|nr:hypothetical protein [Pseudonocardia sp. KRD291]MBW0101068.1 hypothetical protein [Pseudonocardia sp. KRD291]